MEFLFIDTGASFEALLVLICLAVILAIYAYDGYVFLRRFFSVFQKFSPVTNTQENEDTASPTHTEVETAEKDNQQPTIENTPEDTPTESTEITPIENTTKEEKVTEDEIFADYVALVDETHAEKLEESSQVVNEEISLTNEPQDDIGSNSGVSTSEDTSSAEDEHISDTLTKDIPDTAEKVEDYDFDSGASPTVPEDTNSVDASITPAESSQTEEILEEDVIDKEILPEENKEISLDEKSPEETFEDSQKENKSILPEMSPQKHISEVNISPSEHLVDDTPQKNHTETLFALINNIRTMIARGQTTEARVLVIQGLALDKSNRDLNLLLGSLYEMERQFEKAEFVYKDLAIDHPEDVEILEKLGNVLIIEKRYSIGLEIYKKILTLGGETEGTLYILCHLCHELGDANEGYTYMKKYLKSWPNNPEILSLMSEVEIELDKRKDAIETLKRLKNLTPYNSEIAATLQKLMMEEELAGNFGEK